MPASGRPSIVRVASIVLLTAAVLRVWHLLLFRQYLDQPAAVAGWLAVTVLLAALVFRVSAGGLVTLGLFGCAVFLFHWGFERAASDGREYFVQVRSLVIDRDLDFSNENAIFGTRGAAPMYPFGTALLWAPFMVLAHLWFKLLNLFGAGLSVDGFTNPYQRAVGLGTLIYGFAGLVLVHRVLRDYFSRRMAGGVTVAIAAGTFFLWYIAIENSMTHGVSMFAVTLFLYVWHRGRPRIVAGLARTPSAGWWILLGATGGLMTMVRWQNIAFAALACVLAWWPTRRSGMAGLRTVGVFGGAFLVAALPQLLFWKIVRGAWVSLPAADHGFDLASPHIANILFSPNHGLLATTPLVYFALLGLPFFLRRDPALGLLLIGGFAAQVVINSGSGDWWGGPGFGARRFDGCLLAFGAGLASLLAWLRQRPLVAPALVVASFVVVNTFLMVDVRRQAIPPAEAVTVPDVANSLYHRLGNPFSLPYSAYLGWKYDVDWSMYDRLKGRTYSNIDIDFGEDSDRMFLGRGWLTPERNEAASFRWASGEAATLVLPLRAPAPYRLELSCSPFIPPDGPPQTIAVVINGHNVTNLRLQPGMASYVVGVPAAVLETDWNLIRFEFGYSKSPRDAGLSDDPRSLAVMFDSLRFRVVTGGAP